jgi:hypothetical protein
MRGDRRREGNLLVAIQLKGTRDINLSNLSSESYLFSLEVHLVHRNVQGVA